MKMKRSFLILLVIVSTYLQLVSGKYLELRGVNAERVIGSRKQLILNIFTGKMRDYEREYTFVVTAAACSINIHGYIWEDDSAEAKKKAEEVAKNSGKPNTPTKLPRDLRFGIKSNGDSETYILKNIYKITVSSSSFTYYGVDEKGESFNRIIQCTPQFLPDGDKFITYVSMDEEVPPNFVIKSNSRVYVRPKSLTSSPDSDPNVIIYSCLSVGATLLFLFMGSSSGGLVLWLTKEKKKSKRLTAEKPLSVKSAAKSESSAPQKDSINRKDIDVEAQKDKHNDRKEPKDEKMGDASISKKRKDKRNDQKESKDDMSENTIDVSVSKKQNSQRDDTVQWADPNFTSARLYTEFNRISRE